MLLKALVGQLFKAQFALHTQSLMRFAKWNEKKKNTTLVYNSQTNRPYYDLTSLWSLPGRQVAWVMWSSVYSQGMFNLSGMATGRFFQGLLGNATSAAPGICRGGTQEIYSFGIHLQKTGFIGTRLLKHCTTNSPFIQKFLKTQSISLLTSFLLYELDLCFQQHLYGLLCFIFYKIVGE